MKEVYVADKSQRVRSLAVVAIDHRSGERKHIQQSLSVVHRAADISARIVFSKILLVVIGGLRGRGQIVGELIGDASTDRRGVRTRTQAESRLGDPGAAHAL